MSKAKKGEYIYNQIQQLLIERNDIELHEVAKLASAFCLMKMGKKEWIDKLFNILFKQIDQFSIDLLTEVIPAFCEYKGMENSHYQLIEKRVI